MPCPGRRGSSIEWPWSASARKGGSPGAADPTATALTDQVLINEILAHSEAPQTDYIELFNYSPFNVDLSGCTLSDDPATNKFRIPDGTSLAPGGHLVFDEAHKLAAHFFGSKLEKTGRFRFAERLGAQTRLMPSCSVTQHPLGLQGLLAFGEQRAKIDQCLAMAWRPFQHFAVPRFRGIEILRCLCDASQAQRSRQEPGFQIECTAESLLGLRCPLVREQ